MGLPSHCFFKGFKIPFWKKPTTADHYKDPNPGTREVGIKRKKEYPGERP
jgi:hypothetical protein